MIVHNRVGVAPRAGFTINGHVYDQPYWLADGIYPAFACFVKSVRAPSNPKEANFAAAQEARRKDVERMFGMLQARWHILTTPCRLWSKDAMRDVVVTCCILHNMILEFEMDMLHLETNPAEWTPSEPFMVFSAAPDSSVKSLTSVYASVLSSETHLHLQSDLIEYRWSLQQNQ